MAGYFTDSSEHAKWHEISECNRCDLTGETHIVQSRAVLMIGTRHGMTAIAASVVNFTAFHIIDWVGIARRVRFSLELRFMQQAVRHSFTWLPVSHIVYSEHDVFRMAITSQPCHAIVLRASACNCIAQALLLTSYLHGQAFGDLTTAH